MRRLLVRLAVLALVALTVLACRQDVAPSSSDASPSASAAAATSVGPGSPSLSPAETPPASSASSARSPTEARSRIGLPDPARTPGATNPAVAPATLSATACRTGWTSTVRPPVSFTGTLKRAQILEFGYADRDPAHYQEDHLIPLSVGGAPSDPRNLWPQPLAATLPDGTRVGADVKDAFELWVHDRLCHGIVSLAEAQAAFARDWVAAWEAAGRP